MRPPRSNGLGGSVSTINSYVGHGVTLGNGYTSPLTITTAGTVDDSGGIAVFAAATYANPVVINQGTILETGFGGVGVAFNAGGSLDNSGTAALIEGQYGVQIRGTAGTITNAGTIEGTNGRAIYLTQGGSVDNSGTAALIRSLGTAGSNYGVEIFNAAGAVTNDGTILGSGGSTAVKLQKSGSVDNTGTAALIRGGFGVSILGTTGTITNAGTIDGTSGTGVALNGGSVDNSGTAALIQAAGLNHAGVRINLAGTVSNAGTIRGTSGYGVFMFGGGTVIDSGTISGGNGTAVEFYGFSGGNLLALEGGYSFGGTIHVLGPGNTLELLGTVGAVTVDFDKSGAGFTNFGTVSFGAASGNDEILKISNTTSLPGTVSGFTQLHDIVDLTQFTNPGAAVVAFDTLTDRLTVTEGSQSVTLQLDTSLDYTGVTWTPSPDSGTGTDVAACYCRGTRILTPDGELPVEDLKIGDQVMTISGSAKPLRWIGRRSYVGWLAAGNPKVLPVCFKPGSLADGVPRRELWVSPEHAIYLDGVLVPAELLVNGTSIVKAASVDEVQYFHLELDAHDVIMAEGAWAESFVDDDSRGIFHNAAEFHRLYPEAPLHAPARYCAPRVEDGFELEALRRKLAGRARRLRADGTAPAAAPLEGHLDLARHDRIEGWARDPAAPTAPVALVVLANGAEIGRVVADRYRPDLAAAGIGDGRHAFELVVPGGLTTAWRHTIEVCRADDGTMLPGSPVVLPPAADGITGEAIENFAA